jgi:hypothetical protein
LRYIRARISREAEELSTDSLAGSAWYEYGGLLVNLRNVVNALAEVVDLARSGQTARRSKRYPVSEKIPGVRRDAGDGRSGLRGLRLGRRHEGYSDRDDHTTS